MFRNKLDESGRVSRNKARLVAQGFKQEEEIDYDETFYLVENMDSILLALAIASSKGWELHQMDVNNDFLHGDLSEEIYMEQPHGFI